MTRLLCNPNRGIVVVGRVLAGIVASAVLACSSSSHSIFIDSKPEFVVHVPQMTCHSEGRFGRCIANDTGELRVRWYLYSSPAQETEGKDFRFEAPIAPTLIEMAVTDFYGDTVRTCVTVIRIHDRAQFSASCKSTT